jgi:hypothetical protein
MLRKLARSLGGAGGRPLGRELQDLGAEVAVNENGLQTSTPARLSSTGEPVTVLVFSDDIGERNFSLLHFPLLVRALAQVRPGLPRLAHGLAGATSFVCRLGSPALSCAVLRAAARWDVAAKTRPLLLTTATGAQLERPHPHGGGSAVPDSEGLVRERGAL